MIYYGKGHIECESGEPVMDICPDCANQSRTLLNVTKLHICVKCSRYYIMGKYFEDLPNNLVFDDHFESRGVMPGMSTNVLKQN